MMKKMKMKKSKHTTLTYKRLVQIQTMMKDIPQIEEDLTIIDDDDVEDEDDFDDEYSEE